MFNIQKKKTPQNKLTKKAMWGIILANITLMIMLLYAIVISVDFTPANIPKILYSQTIVTTPETAFEDIYSPYSSIPASLDFEYALITQTNGTHTNQTVNSPVPAFEQLGLSYDEKTFIFDKNEENILEYQGLANTTGYPSVSSYWINQTNNNLYYNITNTDLSDLEKEKTVDFNDVNLTYYAIKDFYGSEFSYLFTYVPQHINVKALSDMKLKVSVPAVSVIANVSEILYSSHLFNRLTLMIFDPDTQTGITFESGLWQQKSLYSQTLECNQIILQVEDEKLWLDVTIEQGSILYIAFTTLTGNYKNFLQIEEILYLETIPTVITDFSVLTVMEFNTTGTLTILYSKQVSEITFEDTIYSIQFPTFSVYNNLDLYGFMVNNDCQFALAGVIELNNTWFWQSKTQLEYSYPVIISEFGNNTIFEIPREYYQVLFISPNQLTRFSSVMLALVTILTSNFFIVLVCAWIALFIFDRILQKLPKPDDLKNDIRMNKMGQLTLTSRRDVKLSDVVQDD